MSSKLFKPGSIVGRKLSIMVLTCRLGMWETGLETSENYTVSPIQPEAKKWDFYLVNNSAEKMGKI